MPQLHATGEALDLLVLGLLHGKDLELLESHIIQCTSCAEALKKADLRVALVRESLKLDFNERKSAAEAAVKSGRVLIFESRSV